MLKKKFLTASGLAIALSLSLSACGGGGDDAATGDESTGTDGGGAVTLSIWHNSTTGDGKAWWEEVTAAYTEANPDVTFDIRAVQNEDMDGQLQNAVNSGDLPDIFMARGGQKLADFVEADAVKDLTDKIDADVKSDIEGALGAFVIDGKTYAMPTAVLPGGMFYSKDLFAAAGITAEPKTMDELNAAVTALKGTGVQPIALGAQDAWPAAHWYYFFALRECSKDVIDAISSNPDFSDGCWLKAGEDFQTFAATEPFNTGFLTTPAQEGAGSSAGLLANHQAAMELMGGWDVGVIASLTPDQQPLPDLGWFPFPAVTGGAGDPSAMMGGVDGFSCSKESPAQCEDFLNFMMSQEWQESYAEAYQTIPASKAAQGAVADPALEPIMAAYNDAAYVITWLDTLLGQNVGNALNTAVVEMLAGNGSPQGILDTIEQAAARG
ncbi:MAG: extracellular solute-binding protein [Propionibacteriaceae bacterium]|jgi:multiple sugar transport system substrate-binding protein/raffinose/stachyose/melibiose transport system substrate-binding protein|nr:extracellular solute-binding protein [Propionibacteriaceae bacterium]